MTVDRRIRKTKDVITTTLITLLQTTPLEKITVSKIVELADISRSTFYAHYNDVFDLYNQMIHESLVDLMNRLEASYPVDEEPDFLDFVTETVDYISDNVALFRSFVKYNNLTVINELKDLFVNKVIAVEHQDGNDLQVHFNIVWCVSGTIGIILEWLDNDLQPPKEDVIKGVTNIMNKL
ncbi:TetR/AcrR family transcriptional regulator [Levilactobacillus brevis]|uniref:TetR/AcrR family transcriptional regulator n=1 Tax=Levilactobacillus brevis TaxID=1580 RepID=UPI00111A1ED4|nr:TetR/AcrR family transcriptional regulator [Levilactobacillus brevis]QCZ46834.1 hypothetical protein UCCLB556_1959 [Levilactobacillus brevis]